jgi:hypothetical protein
MRSYRDISIRHKLQGIVVISCGVALFVASVIFMVYDQTTFRRAWALQQQLGGAAIAVIRKAKAAGVDDKPFSSLWACNAPNVGAMNMRVDGNPLA